jgi:hypothetical protein
METIASAADMVLPGDNTRRPAREVEFLRSVAGPIEQATGSRVSYSSNAHGPTVRGVWTEK